MFIDCGDNRWTYFSLKLATLRLIPRKREPILVWELVSPFIAMAEAISLSNTSWSLNSFFGDFEAWGKRYYKIMHLRPPTTQSFRQDILVRLKSEVILQQRWKNLEYFLKSPFAWSLNSGCSNEAIMQAEDRLGITFPIEISSSLAIHDGQRYHASGIQPFGRLFSLEEIVRDSEFNRELSEGCFLPLTEPGPQLFVDTDSGKIYTKQSLASPICIAPSWSTYLAPG